MGVPYNGYGGSNHTREDFIDIECEHVEEHKLLMFHMTSTITSQNNYYLVFSRCFGDIISWTKDLQIAMDADNQFTIVRGYKVT